MRLRACGFLCMITNVWNALIFPNMWISHIWSVNVWIWFDLNLSPFGIVLVWKMSSSQFGKRKVIFKHLPLPLGNANCDITNFIVGPLTELFFSQFRWVWFSSESGVKNIGLAPIQKMLDPPLRRYTFCALQTMYFYQIVSPTFFANTTEDDYIEIWHFKSVADPGFPRSGPNLKDGGDSLLFSQLSLKTAWKWRKLGQHLSM